MRKLSIMCAAVVMAACAFGQPKHETVSVSTGTNDTGTATLTTVAGYIDEIVLELPSGALTGTVAVAATPPIGGAVTLASKTITATTLIRPRLDGTGTDGTALTSDPPGRYLSFGDSIGVTVSSANVTGKTWRVWIKWDDGK